MKALCLLLFPVLGLLVSSKTLCSMEEAISEKIQEGASSLVFRAIRSIGLECQSVTSRGDLATCPRVPTPWLEPPAVRIPSPPLPPSASQLRVQAPLLRAAGFAVTGCTCGSACGSWDVRAETTCHCQCAGMDWTGARCCRLQP
ncbi:resistin isoform X1 [Trachypithecus francoisi]|uniref:resistin isoform X1 n=1 Tax=Trachypithecus francoisi TaxID=54180 RepID=UPI00141A6E88|nr:resistin isoform X1 [Trachypithecus francoisi]